MEMGEKRVKERERENGRGVSRFRFTVVVVVVGEIWQCAYRPTKDGARGGVRFIQ